MLTRFSFHERRWSFENWRPVNCLFPNVLLSFEKGHVRKNRLHKYQFSKSSQVFKDKLWSSDILTDITWIQNKWKNTKKLHVFILFDWINHKRFFLIICNAAVGFNLIKCVEGREGLVICNQALAEEPVPKASLLEILTGWLKQFSFFSNCFGGSVLFLNLIWIHLISKNLTTYL